MNSIKPLIASLALASTTSITWAQANNETLGTDAGASITTGDRNVLLGDFAGTNLSTSDHNVMVGNHTGFLINNGSTSESNRNLLLGFRAGAGYTQSEWDAYLAYPIASPLPDIGDTYTFGDDNIFIGYEAGLRNTAGFQNIFIGSNAGRDNSTGYRNTFVGDRAGESNLSGLRNTFIGDGAGTNNTEGRQNTFVGDGSGRANLTGEDNTAIGERAMVGGQDGWGHAIFGWEAGAGNGSVRNTLLGWGAGTDIWDGMFNTIAGAGAGDQTRSAVFNTFVGVYAGAENNRTNGTTGSENNTALGVAAGFSNWEGSRNTSIGAFADMANWSNVPEVDIVTAFSDKVGFIPAVQNNPSRDVSNAVNIGSFGWVSGTNAMGVGYRVRVSKDSATAIGANSNNSHSESVTIGYGTVSHGDRTAVIGTDTTVAWHPSADLTTELGGSSHRFTDVHAQRYEVYGPSGMPAELPFQADDGSQNNDKWTLGADSTGTLRLSSFVDGSQADKMTVDRNGLLTVTGDLLVNSDRRLKEDVEPIADSLGTVSRLEGQTYRWKQDEGRDSQRHFGFIAQEVEAVVPELVMTNTGNDIKSVNYQGVIPLLIDSVNQLNELHLDQQQEIETLRTQIAKRQEVLERHLRLRNARTSPSAPNSQ